jgi:hypothetical protein
VGRKVFTSPGKGLGYFQPRVLFPSHGSSYGFGAGGLGLCYSLTTKDQNEMLYFRKKIISV